MIFWIFFLLLILLGIWFCIEQHVLRVRKQTLSLEHLPAGWTVFPCCKSPICTTGKWQRQLPHHSAGTAIAAGRDCPHR
mgnify:CR=1 FL=1